MRINKEKNIKLFLLLICFFIVGLLSIYSFSAFLYKNQYTLLIRQSIFFVIGFLLIFIIKKIDIKIILKYSFIIYILNILLLLFVLVFGSAKNGIKAWIDLPIIGSFQPSEFMKIGIILLLSKLSLDFECKKSCFKEEFLFILKSFIIILIPSILTFLEPDTGAVFIYIIIFIFILFASKLRKRWLFMFFIILLLGLSSIIFLYLKEKDIFISIFGSSLFYRLDRLFNWSTSSGMQLENSLIIFGSSGLFGRGINSIDVYFPEGHTDFIFTSFFSIFGLFGSIILFLLFIFFDFCILNMCNKKSNIYKYITFGIAGILIYQQIQNISMTIGILPITGITLPFISYGGSSLISYMILLGLLI